MTLIGDAAETGPPAESIDELAAALAAIEPGRWRADAGPLADLLRVAAATGARAVQVALDPADDATDAALGPSGFVRTREILQLRRPLPLEPVHATPAGADELRSFRPGLDEAEWLRVNRRAFAWHPEQGDVDAADLDRLEREGWFDPEGFLIAERHGSMAGFCWTKVHGEADPVLGEIFAIGVDPDHQGSGLGRHLVVAGLGHLAAVGAPMGMLWVEADNAAALALYDDLGFGVDHRKRYYRRATDGTGAG